MAVRAGGCPILVGRDRELEVLREAAGRARSGVPTLVLVTGEAGSGKSRLARELVAETPGATLVEDLHERDPSDIAGLAATLTDLDLPLLVATWRLGSHPIGSASSRAAATLLRDGAAVELRLGPLSVAAMRSMLASMHGEAAAIPSVVADLHERSGGNAFLAEEMIVSGDAAPSWNVAEAVLARLEALTPPARHAAELLALVADDLSEEALTGLVGHPETGDELVGAFLAVEPEPARFRMRHALVADAVRSLLPGSRTRELHRALARALEGAEPPVPAQIAAHWTGAGDHDAAGAWALRAADHLQDERRFGLAVEQYRVALRHLPDDPLARGELLERAAQAAGWLSDVTTALAWADMACEAYKQSSEPWRGAAIWVGPALRHLRSASFADGLAEDHPERLVTEGWRLAREDPVAAGAMARQAREISDRVGDVLALSDHNELIAAVGDAQDAIAHQERLIARCELAGDLQSTSLLTHFLAHIHRSMGYERLFTELAGRSLALGDAVDVDHDGEPAFRLALLLGLGGVLAYQGDFDAAQLLAVRLKSALPPMGLLLADGVQVVIDVAQGRTDKAVARLNRLQVVRSLHNLNYLRPVLIAEVMHAWLEGDAARVLALLDEYDRESGAPFAQFMVDRHLYRARACAALGRWEEVDCVVEDAALMARSSAGPSIQAVAEAVQGIAARGRGEHSAAAECFERAATWWETAPRRVLAAEMLCDAAEAHIASDAPARAGEAVARAIAVAQELSLVPVARRCGEIEQALAGPAVPRRLASLTPRELDVAREVAAGRSGREIAETLGISEKRVRNMLTTIYAKAGVSRRTELVALFSQR